MTVMKEFGIESTLFRSSNTNSLRRTLNKIPSNIDAIWLPTDPTWLTPENFYHINNTGIKKSIPILSNSTYLAQAGALLSISSNHESIGMLSAEIVTQIFDGTPIESLSTDLIAQEAYITLNRDTQKAIGVELEPFMFDFINQQITQ